MSKASEFYPGTTERVCLISGPAEGILQINDFFLDNFSSSAVKILVPNSTAGMIIGKGGSFIKQIKEESGAHIQISQKSQDCLMPERCITIVGELDDIRKACAMIMTKIVEDVGSGNCLNINYRDTRQFNSFITSPITASLTSTPTLSQSQTHLSSFSSPQLINSSISTPTSININDNAQISTSNHLFQNHQTNSNNFIKSSSSPTVSASASSMASSINCAELIESIKSVLRMSGYGDEAVLEISSAMATLSNYGILGVGLGLL